MSLLDPLERRLGRFAIPNLSLYLVIGQVFVLLSAMLGLLDLSYFVLVPALAQHGEWWRVLTFIFMPPPPGMFGYVFTAFAWYIFYLMSGALEGFWGEFRFNLFLFTNMSLGIKFQKICYAAGAHDQPVYRDVRVPGLCVAQP